MYTLRTSLRENRVNKHGESVLYFIIQDVWISTDIAIPKAYWIKEHSAISHHYPQFYQINPIYLSYRSRAEQYLSNLNINGTAFNRKQFSAFVFKANDQADNPTIAELIKEYCALMNIGWGRTKHYTTLKNDFSLFMPQARIQDIDFTVAMKFQNYLRLRVESKNNENTIMRKMRQLKALVHFAQRKGLLKTNTLSMVKLKEITGNKNHLTASELGLLELKYQEQSLDYSEQTVLRYFLFSCYTGLRFSDIVKLNGANIINSCVVATQEKTNKQVMIPLIPQAVELLSTTSQLCFNTYGNQVTNKILKRIIEKTGIEKKITYHCSRHTFGTLSIYWGIPVDIVADLLGVDIKTAKIYAKIVDEVKIREMQKWHRAAV
ncbi:MAG: tyrosine-type recombinase/integrase [Ferruginibacter sp.]